MPGQARWLRRRSGHLFTINWARWLSGSKPVDPYLVWAEVSRFSGFGGWPKDSPNPRLGDGRWPFLFELARDVPRSLPQTDKPSSVIFAMMEISGLYVVPITDPDPGPATLATRFVTARIRLDDFEQLLGHPHVERMQLGVPRLPGEPSFRLTGPLTSGSQQGDAGHPRTVVGIIDDGCAFAHPTLCNKDGVPRVHFLWDQDGSRAAGDGGWHVLDDLGYGSELWHENLNSASQLAQANWSDEAAYAKVNYGPVRIDLDLRGSMFRLPPDAPVWPQSPPVGTMLRAAHGTSALFLAAGVQRDAPDPRPLRQQRATADPQLPDKEGVDGTVDFASRWPIVFVQLPTATTLDTSGGSLGVHVLDGIRYIIDRASCLPYDVNSTAGDRTRPDTGSERPASLAGPDATLNRQHGFNKIVINISYGAVAGPHDGTSILEQAMADLVRAPTTGDIFGLRHATWICVAAGNAHRSRTHARLSLAPGQSKSLAWRVPPDNPLQSFLEVWLPESDAEGRALATATWDRIALQVTPPGGVPGQRVRCGQLWVCQLDGDDHTEPRVVAGAVFARRVAQGLRGTMVLLAAAATRPGIGKSEFAAPHGLWLVEVSNETGSSEAGVNPGREIVINAWAERNDLVYGTPRAQQATVEAEDRIPDPTESTPDARRYLESLQRPWPNRHLDDQMQPRPSLGSLAGASSAKAGKVAFYDLDEFEYGQVVAAGGYRMADGEAADYASGGPHRHVIDRSMGQPSLMSAEVEALYEATGSAPRMQPDVQAPSDIGPALRGLRTVGMRAGSVARLSGTSASAPSAARLIANTQHAKTWFDDPAEVGSRVDGKDFGAVQPPMPHSGPPEALRTTPTPIKDDRFRRGPWRIR